ncbi:MAG: hypothetical protein EXS32_12030 [Opitutus sp.]|nr:hypothetical protein [Opitutus sp.]
MKTPLLLVLALALIASPGCGTAPTATISPGLTLTLEASPKHVAASLRAADELRIVLPAPAGPDYVWQVVANDPQLLRQTSEVKYAPATAPGAAGTATITFRALLPGRVLVRFVYVRAVARAEAEPTTDQYEVTINVRS